MRNYFNNKHIFITIFSVIFLIIILYYNIIFKPQIKYLNDIDKSIQTKLELLSAKEIEFYKLEENKSKIKKNEYHIKSLEDNISKYVDISNIIKGITTAINLYEINVDSVQWENTIPIDINEETIYKSCFKLSLFGLYDNIYNFLEALKISKNIFTLDKININVSNIKENFIETKLYISTYSTEKINYKIDKLYNDFEIDKNLNIYKN